MTITFRTKWLWLTLAIVFGLIALAPVLSAYYPTTQASSSGGSQAATTPSVSGNSTASSTAGSPSSGSGGPAVNCNNPCTIVIQNSQFGTTDPIVVKAGTTVTWVNHDDTEHTSTSDNGIWSSPILSPGQSFSHTFSTTGTYPYKCEIHPMTGTIIVVS